MKKIWIVFNLWCLVECFTGTLWVHSSLAFSSHGERILGVALYYHPHCPHAIEILPLVKSWIELQGFDAWQGLPPTEYYPSPTLRILYQEYGVNYIGKHEILSFIQS